MMNLFKNKWISIPVGIIVLLLFIINPFNQPTTKPIPSRITNLNVTSVSPNPLAPLSPNQQQSFVISLDQPISTSDIDIELTRNSLTKDEAPVPIEIYTSLSNGNRQVNISTRDTIPPLSVITITVKNNTVVIFTTTFSTDALEPTPIQTNNQELIPYLPYATESYTLTFDREGNIYVFSFIYNPGSPDDLETQFEKAKADAVQFIESKGIDINTVIVEWNYS